MRRMVLPTVVLIALLSRPCAYAEEDFGKSAVAQTLLKMASKHRSASAHAETRRSAAAEAQPAPYAYSEEAPADADELMARIEAQNGALVAEFEHLIEKDPLNPDAPKWLSQIAEFHYQTAHYAYLRARRAWMSGLETCGEDAETCEPEPVADYSQSIADYRRLYATYPGYEKMDSVLFRLGDALIRNRQAKEGISYLHKLTQQYPDCKDLDAAYLAIGEYFFSQKNTGTAQAAYRKILAEYPSSPYRRYAEYKLAWTYLNLGDEDAYREAIALFKSAVESIDRTHAAAIGSDGLIDENKLQIGEVSFRNQALNDMSATYAELPDGWKEARDYLQAKLPPDKALNKIDQLGAILDGKGKYEEEIALYGELLEAHPTAERVADWHMARISAFEASNRKAEAEAETRRAIEALLPTGAWHRANADAQQAVRAARRFSAECIYALALGSVGAGEKSESRSERNEKFADAEQLLGLAIDTYLSEIPAFDVYYSYAYVLDELSDMALSSSKAGKKRMTAQEKSALLPRLRKAAEVYQNLIDWPEPDGETSEQIRVAANRQVFVYANILAADDPSWSIERSAKTQNFVEEKRDGKISAKEALTESERAFAQSAEQYAARYPTDGETPAFLWRAAEIYRSRNDYDQAAQRFDQIITHFPDHEYAAVSVGSMFELYYKADRFDKIEYWAKYMRDRNNYKYYSAQELEDTAAFAIDRQAAELSQKGDADGAASALLRIESSFPARRDLATSARLKAASIEEARQGYRAAADLLQPIVRSSDTGADTNLRAALASYRRAGYLSQIARYAEAAQGWRDAAELYFRELSAQTDVAASETSPKADRKSSKNTSPGTAKTSPELYNSSDADSLIKASLSVVYGAQTHKGIGDAEGAAELLDLYIQNNGDGRYDICRRGADIVLCAAEKDRAQDNASEMQIVANRLSAATERAELMHSAAEKYDYLSAKIEELTASSDDVSARHALLQTLSYANDAGKRDAAQTLIGKVAAGDDAGGGDKAWLAYEKGRCAQLAFEDVALEFPIRVLRKRIEEKAKKRQTAENYYREAISYRNARISTAAAHAMAQMALHFRDAFRELPPPRELENDPQGLEEYTAWIEDELVYPAEDAAASLLDVARQITVQLESYTPPALLSAQSLAQLKPDEYPVAKSSIE